MKQGGTTVQQAYRTLGLKTRPWIMIIRNSWTSFIIFMTDKNNEVKKSSVALREEAILEYWKENSIFEKSLEKEAPQGDYVFYDGPPFATGLPHYGHILGSTAKDVIARYQTMRGFRVPRRWGWDCHGLPIENIVEKELGISGKNAINEYGVKNFTEYARSKVLTYVSEWEKTIDRIGRFVDFKNSYKTMDNSFIESVWWALGELNKKELLYEGVRVLAYCPRCETPIANSEIAMDNSYKDITDISVYVKFKILDEKFKDTYLLAWTTTPWTLPGNTAIAVNASITYQTVSIKDGDAGEGSFVIAKDLVEKVLKDKQYEIVQEISGADLVGLSYEPIFDYYKDATIPNKENAWKVWDADFVTADQGTGIAHEAPAYGEDDMNLAKKYNIPFVHHVTTEGVFAQNITDFAGMKAKPKEDHQAGDVMIIKHLAKIGALFAKEKIIHSYPHCYRCDTPLIYYALPSWFVNIQKVKDSILKRAETMTWIPENLKEGRFKHIVEGAPDWTISRNRFWASPLPIWKSATGKIAFVSSLSDLKQKTKKSGNTYFVMRHGEAENNTKHIWDSNVNSTVQLTDVGIQQVRESAQSFKDKKIDMIICSPLLRTKMTAEIVAGVIGYPVDQIVFDERLREVHPGEVYQGKPIQDFLSKFLEYKERYLHENTEGENYADVKRRVMSALYDFEKTYKDKNILIFSHGGAIMNMIIGSIGLSHSQIPTDIESLNYPKNAEWKQLEFIPLPHNDNYELDLHRPYIDEISLEIDGEEYKRIPEVIDCWFESGSMPFAQDHFPFGDTQDKPSAQSDWKEKNFPAGFVAEYIAQTRTWFYYTHAISTILFDHAPFENVVTTGTLRATDGQKMSKSKGNYPDPWILFDRFGVDALRLYLMGSPLMKGEDSNFSEKAVDDIYKKIITRLDNVYAFYSLYQKDRDVLFDVREAKNILDQWIILRLNDVIHDVTEAMQTYELDRAVRPFDLFVDDLSTWYLRRSRDRFKDEESEDAISARGVLSHVLKTTATLLAPFAPFIAEDLYRKLGGPDMKESVHLENWPIEAVLKESHETVIIDMAKTREVVSWGLEARQKVGIKVKQPLAKLKIKNQKLNTEYSALVQDEVNVKEVVIDESISEVVELDTEITPELKREGEVREFIRAVQDLRKQAGLIQDDNIRIEIQTNAEGQSFLDLGRETIMPIVGARDIVFIEIEGEEIRIGDYLFVVKIIKE